jgi:hypothetical protein
MPNFIMPSPRFDPNSPHKLFIPYFSTDAYRFSFFPRTCRDWNTIPNNIVEAGSFEAFKSALTTYSF